MNSMKRRWNEQPECSTKKAKESDSDDDMQEDEFDEEGESDEEIDLIQQKAYEKLLPEVKYALGNETPNLLRDNTFRYCAVCPTLQKFKGWRALMTHAKTIKTKRVQQHRGYYRALEEVITPQAVQERRLQTIAQARVKHIAAEEVKKNVVRPPVVIVKNFETKEEVWKFIFQRIEEASLSGTFEANKNTMLLVFKEEPHFSVQSDFLETFFAEKKRGRESALKGMIGYRADPKDMENIDPEKKLVNWRVLSADALKDIESVENTYKESTERTAKVHEAKLRVFHLDAHKENIQTEKNHLQIMLHTNAREIEKCIKDTEEMKHLQEEENKRDDEKFQRHLLNMEEDFARNEKRWRMQLEFQHTKTEKQKLDHLRYLKTLRQAHRSGTEQAKETSSKLLSLESEKSKMEDELKATHDEWLTRVEKTNNEKLEQQENQKMELLEQFKREKEAFMNSWREEEEKLKKELGKDIENELKQNTNVEKTKECAVCFEELVKRSVFACGHVLCTHCAMNLFEKKLACPICRKTLRRAPVPLPDKVY